MKKKVWLVEDDEDIRSVIEMLLIDSNYDVVCFANASTFKDALVRIDPDVVILDVRLPDGSGIELCALLKSDSHTSPIPVLMMSANTSTVEIEKHCHPECFIHKPFDIEDFMYKVNQLSRPA